MIKIKKNLREKVKTSTKLKSRVFKFNVDTISRIYQMMSHIVYTELAIENKYNVARKITWPERLCGQNDNVTRKIMWPER